MCCVAKFPPFPVQRQSDCLAQFYFYDQVQKRTMALLLPLDHASFPQEYRIYIKCVFHNFFKRPTIRSVKSKQYGRANMFSVNNSLGALKDNQLNQYPPLRVLLPSLYTVEFHWEGSEKSSPEFPDGLPYHCIGIHMSIFHLSCHLPYSVI